MHVLGWVFGEVPWANTRPLTGSLADALFVLRKEIGTLQDLRLQDELGGSLSRFAKVWNLPAGCQRP